MMQERLGRREWLFDLPDPWSPTFDAAKYAREKARRKSAEGT